MYRAAVRGNGLELPMSHDRKIMVPLVPAVRPAMVAVGHSGGGVHSTPTMHACTCCSAAAVHMIKNYSP